MVINQRCIRDGRFNPFVMRRHSSTVQMDKLVQSGDVLINSTGIGTLGRVAQVLSPPRNCTVDSHVTIVRPVPEIDVDFLGAMLLAMEHHFASLGVGSTGQTELSRDRISDTLVLTASVDHQGAFGAVVHPLRERSGGVVEANQLLRDTRDLLLRHLMTGTQLT